MPKKKQQGKSDKVWVERDLLNSKAWISLPVGIAPQVYFLFLAKRQMGKVNRKSNRYEIINNGELIFTYESAEKLGITPPRFQRAIDALYERGFIDITEVGIGTVKGACSKYAISDRWRAFGTPDFIEKQRQPSKLGGSKDPFGHKERADSCRDIKNNLHERSSKHVNTLTRT